MMMLGLIPGSMVVSNSEACRITVLDHLGSSLQLGVALRTQTAGQDEHMSACCKVIKEQMRRL